MPSGDPSSSARAAALEGLSPDQRGALIYIAASLAFIRTAQRVGLTLEDVHGALAQLPDNRTPTKSDWERLSRSWKTELDARIDALYRLRDRLTGCIGCGCLSLRSCALQNIDDEQASHGPGAPKLKPVLEGGTA